MSTDVQEASKLAVILSVCTVPTVLSVRGCEASSELLGFRYRARLRSLVGQRVCGGKPAAEAAQAGSSSDRLTN